MLPFGQSIAYNRWCSLNSYDSAIDGAAPEAFGAELAGRPVLRLVCTAFRRAFAEVRITDFGLAIEQQAESQAAEIAGAPAYMTPERLAGKGATVQSDMYSLGLVLCEIYTGKKAFTARSFLPRASTADWRDRRHTLKMRWDCANSAWESVRNQRRWSIAGNYALRPVRPDGHPIQDLQLRSHREASSEKYPNAAPSAELFVCMVGRSSFVCGSLLLSKSADVDAGGHL
jgi:serine/threonine protein kinase